MGALRKLLKALAWLTGGLIGLVVVLYLVALAINWHDRPPSEAALRFAAAYRDRPLVADTDNAFVYASGFFVKPGEDPQAAGVRRIAWMTEALQDPSRASFSTSSAYDYKAAQSAAVPALAGRAILGPHARMFRHSHYQNDRGGRAETAFQDG